MSSIHDVIDIQVTSRAELNDRLDAAHQELQEVAMRTKTHGILITRLGTGAYSAMLSAQVRYGETREYTL